MYQFLTIFSLKVEGEGQKVEGEGFLLWVRLRKWRWGPEVDSEGEVFILELGLTVYFEVELWDIFLWFRKNDDVSATRKKIFSKAIFWRVLIPQFVSLVIIFLIFWPKIILKNYLFIIKIGFKRAKRKLNFQKK